MSELKKVIITGHHTEENIKRFQSIPGCEIVFAEKIGDIPEEAFADTEMLVGFPSKDVIAKMPKLRFIHDRRAYADHHFDGSETDAGVCEKPAGSEMGAAP